MSVTLLQIIAAAQSRQASLVGEMVGYLLLEAADQVVGGPRRVGAEAVVLEEGGLVRVTATQSSDGAGCEAELRQLLSDLLCFSRTVTPSLMRCGTRAPRGGVEDLVRELEAALIPVNRAAGKRALARLHRETLRAVQSGGLPAVPAAPVQVRLPELAPPVGEVEAESPPAPPCPVEESPSRPAAAPVHEAALRAVAAVSEPTVMLEREEATDPVPAAWESSAFWMEPRVQEHTLPLTVAATAVDLDPEIEIEVVIDEDELDEVYATPILAAPQLEETAALPSGTPMMPPVAEPPGDGEAPAEPLQAASDPKPPAWRVAALEEPEARLTAEPPCFDSVDAEWFEAAQNHSPVEQMDAHPGPEPESVSDEATPSGPSVVDDRQHDSDQATDGEAALEAEPGVPEMALAGAPHLAGTESAIPDERAALAELEHAPDIESGPVASGMAAEPVSAAETSAWRESAGPSEVEVSPAAGPAGDPADASRPGPAVGLESSVAGIVEAELAEVESARDALVCEEIDAIPAEPVEWVPVSPPVETRTPAPAVEEAWDDPTALSESRPSTLKSPEESAGRFASAPPVFAPRRSDVEDLLRRFASGQSDDEICVGLADIAQEYSPAAPAVGRWRRPKNLREQLENAPVLPGRVVGASKH